MVFSIREIDCERLPLLPLTMEMKTAGTMAAAPAQAMQERGAFEYHLYALQRPTLHHIELGYDGFAYDYERVTLPLAAGDDLPPMVLTLISVDVARSREFWHRFNADGQRDRSAPTAVLNDD